MQTKCGCNRSGRGMIRGRTSFHTLCNALQSNSLTTILDIAAKRSWTGKLIKIGGVVPFQSIHILKTSRNCAECKSLICFLVNFRSSFLHINRHKFKEQSDHNSHETSEMTFIETLYFILVPQSNMIQMLMIFPPIKKKNYKIDHKINHIMSYLLIEIKQSKFRYASSNFIMFRMNSTKPRKHNFESGYEMALPSHYFT